MLDKIDLKSVGNKLNKKYNMHIQLIGRLINSMQLQLFMKLCSNKKNSDDISKMPINRMIGGISRYGHSYLKRELRTYKMGGQQYHILHELLRAGCLNQDTFYKKYNVDKTTITRTLAKLEENGYIKKEKDLDDKRAYSISLTEKGLDVCAHTKDKLEELNKILLTDFTDEEKKTFAVLLGKAYKNILDVQKTTEESI